MNGLERGKILREVKPDVIDAAVKAICLSVIRKGLSFRQAEAILDIAKERLKDAEI